VICRLAHHGSTVCIEEEKAPKDGDNTIAPHEMATLRRPIRVQGKAAPRANRGVLIFDIL
jgi:hypothetical protein